MVSTPSMSSGRFLGCLHTSKETHPQWDRTSAPWWTRLAIMEHGQSMDGSLTMMSTAISLQVGVVMATVVGVAVVTVERLLFASGQSSMDRSLK